MPRYYFHTADGGRDCDPDGLDLPDDIAARHEAIRYGGAILRDQPETLIVDRDFRVEVFDEHRHLLMTVVMMAVDARAEPPTG